MEAAQEQGQQVSAQAGRTCLMPWAELPAALYLIGLLWGSVPILNPQMMLGERSHMVRDTEVWS